MQAPPVLRALLLSLWLFASSAQAQALPEARVDADQSYVLQARLDAALHRVQGSARIRWVNTSRVPQSELFFHLYLNAFADEESIFMRESGGQLRGDRFRGEGHIELHSLQVGGEERLEALEDDLEEHDRTQARLPLRTPVPPGGSIDLEVDFVSQLPPVFARSGYHGDFHMVAQWFPKLARLEADGQWQRFAYHGHGEFYADFARYELEVDAPAGWKVGATGTPAAERREGDRTIHRFVAERVHDCAFAAAPDFQERRERYARADGTHVDVRLLYPPGYASALEAHVEVTLAGLAHYGSFLGPYPYETLTVVVPPRGADGAAGMEYPTLFVTAGPWLRIPGAPIVFHEEVTAHELAHQWFQGMIATNEVRWPMLDEGLTEWATGDLLQARHGRDRSGLALGGLRADGFELRRAFAFQRPTPPPGRPAHEFQKSAYGRSVYMRTSAILETVARTWGRDRFRRALGAYARRHRFAHPVPEDLFDAFDDEYGEWMSRKILRPALMHGAFADLSIESLTLQRRETGWRTRLVVVRRGELPIPTHVELFADAQQRRRIPWPGDVPRLELDLPGRWAGARVDPDGHVLVDSSRLDNVARAQDAPPMAHGTLFARILFGLQAMLGVVGP